MAKKDYYKVLGIPKTATHDEIKSAFKKQAKQYHPDMNPDQKGAEEKFKEVSEAYEVLGDAKKRKQYDQFGAFDFGSEGPHNPYTQNYWQSVNMNDFDLNDIFGEIFGMGGAKRGRRGAGRMDFDFGGVQQHRSRNGSDLVWTLPIEFLDAVNGCEKQILLSDGKKIKVKIPAGVDNGSKIRVAGKGNPGVAGGQSGDLIIEISVRSHPYFKREGDDITMDLDVPLADAISGSTLNVMTIDGSVQLKIPKGAQSGQKLRLKGKGARNLQTKIRGHLYVNIMVKYPKDLSEGEIRQILQVIERHSD